MNYYPVMTKAKLGKERDEKNIIKYVEQREIDRLLGEVEAVVKVFRQIWR